MKWTIAALTKLKAEGKIRDFTTSPETEPAKAEQKKPKAVYFIEKTLENANIAYEGEYKFAEKRKFRFDIAVPAIKLSVEYEGLMSKKSRHTTITGYTKDTTKYNLAVTEGWRVLRYTVLNYKDFEKDLKTILCQ